VEWTNAILMQIQSSPVLVDWLDGLGSTTVQNQNVSGNSGEKKKRKKKRKKSETWEEITISNAPIVETTQQNQPKRKKKLRTSYEGVIMNTELKNRPVHGQKK